MSDRWVAPGCVSLCHDAWAVRKTSVLTCQDIITVYSIPAALHDSPNFAPVMECALKSLLLLFGDVADIIAKPSLIDQLLQLPYAAVLALLSDDKLIADCEDSVLMLLCWWLEGGMGKSCVGRDLTALQEVIRYSQLSTTYLVQVVPNFPRLFPGEGKLLQVMEYREWTFKYPQLQTTESDQEQVYSLPASWLKPCRPIPVGSKTSMLLDLDIASEELQRHLAAAAGMMPDSPCPASFSSWEIFRGLRASVSVFSSSEQVLTAAVQVSLPLPTLHSMFELVRGIPCSLGLDLQKASLGVPFKFEFLTGVSQRKGVVLKSFAQKMTALPGNMLDLTWWQPILAKGVLKLTLRLIDKR